MTSSPIFFLGGYDLEMLVIYGLLQKEGITCQDHGLSWGAKLSDYQSEIEAAHEAGLTPVAVELADNMPQGWPPRSRLVLVDHHGARAAEACSLRQVFELLALPEERWTRDFMLVAANDTGHVRAMREMGARVDEIIDIRARDRAAQGISPEEDLQGRQALITALLQAPLPSAPLIVHLPHDRTATVADPLEIDPEFAGAMGNGTRPLVILGHKAIHVFAERALIDILANTFSGGWSGGQGALGFFGVEGVPEQQVIAVISRGT